MNSKILDEIVEAAVALLRPYFKELTAEQLIEKLTTSKESAETTDIVTREEARDLLKVSLSSIDRMLHAGILTRIKILGAVRIPLSEIEAIKAGKHQG